MIRLFRSECHCVLEQDHLEFPNKNQIIFQSYSISTAKFFVCLLGVCFVLVLVLKQINSFLKGKMYFFLLKIHEMRKVDKI